MSRRGRERIRPFASEDLPNEWASVSGSPWLSRVSPDVVPRVARVRVGRELFRRAVYELNSWPGRARRSHFPGDSPVEESRIQPLVSKLAPTLSGSAVVRTALFHTALFHTARCSCAPLSVLPCSAFGKGMGRIKFARLQSSQVIRIPMLHAQ